MTITRSLSSSLRKWKQILLVTFATLMVPAFIPEATAQEKKSESAIADFEGEQSIARKKTTHKASVTLVDDAPKGGGKRAVKTVIASDAGATQFFGTGFSILRTDLSGHAEIRFWIKTDIESKFSFQCSSGAEKASVAPFTTVGSDGKWKLISAPVAKFSKPRWAKEAADLKAVHFLQVLAFGNGPYDGKTILLDDVVGVVRRLQTVTRCRDSKLQHHDSERQRTFRLRRSTVGTGSLILMANRFSLTELSTSGLCERSLT